MREEETFLPKERNFFVLFGKTTICSCNIFKNIVSEHYRCTVHASVRERERLEEVEKDRNRKIQKRTDRRTDRRKGCVEAGR